MAIKLVAADMDDTLLNPQGELGARTVKAVRAMQRRGVRFVLASGRMPQAMRSACNAFDLRGPVIAYNGALTLDLTTGETLHSAPVPAQLAKEAARMAEELGGHVQAYLGDAYYFAQDNEYARAYAKSIRINGIAVGRRISEWLHADVYKLLVIGAPEQVPCWEKRMREHFGETLRCARSRANYIEVFRSDADKAKALQSLCERYGIRREETAAFGDGENDLRMVRFAKYGYIMANAREDVRAKAERIAPSNAEDGVAQVLETWFEDEH